MGGCAIARGAADWAQADGFSVGTDAGDVCPAQGSYRGPVGFGPPGPTRALMSSRLWLCCPRIATIVLKSSRI